MNEFGSPLQLLLLVGGAFGAAGTVLGGVAWLLREKIARAVIIAVVESAHVAAWVDARVAKVLEEKADAVIDARIAERFGSTMTGWDDWREEKDETDRALEARLAETESAVQVMAKVAESLNENVKRLTTAVQAVSDKAGTQGEHIAGMKGTLEFIARNLPGSSR